MLSRMGFKSNGGVSLNANQEPNTQLTERITAIHPQNDTVGQYLKYEIKVDIEGQFQNPYDPDEVDLGAVFTSPSGVKWNINGFYDGQNWLIRFAANEVGQWKYQIHLITKQRDYLHEELAFAVEPSDARGGLTVPTQEGGRFLNYRNGASFFAAPVAYPWQVQESRLDQLRDAGGNIVTYWNGNYDRVGNGGGAEQLESFQTGPGRYDMNKADRIDEILDWLEERDMLMNFVIWPHDSLAHKINWPQTWQQSAYSKLGEAIDFYDNEEMWKYQEKMYRYIIARWGHSPSLGIWDLICEVNGTDGWMLGDPAKADAWLSRIDTYFKENDPYRHPTMGSMAGNREDYWDYAYKTLDIADRENYYDYHYSAYAEDIQLRYKSYEKPIWIGETGNITDVNVYHRAIWSALSNGLAGLPTWWMEEHMDDAMLTSMKHAVSFAKDIDLEETRKPSLAEAKIEERTRPTSLNLLQFDTYSSWILPDWAEANKDTHGVVYPLSPSGEGPALMINTEMRFATGSYAQGVLEGIPTEHNWSGYEKLELEFKVEGDKGVDPSQINKLKAKIVLHPGGEWREAADANAIHVENGKWVKLQVPLLNAPASYWQDGEVSPEHLMQMGRMGIKFYDVASNSEAKPVNISLRNVKLVASKPPVQQVKMLEGFLMEGEKTSYGWAVSEEENLAEKQVVFGNWGASSVEVVWYDPWIGEVVTKQTVHPDQSGKLSLQIPSGYNKQDIAYKLNRL